MSICQSLSCRPN